MFEDFGERLRKLRTAANMTQKELGKKVNRGVGAISKYESGAMKPTLDVAVDLAFYLKVSLDELFGYENKSTVSVFGLTDEQKEIVSQLIFLFRTQSKTGTNLTPEQCEIIGKIIDDFRSPA